MLIKFDENFFEVVSKSYIGLFFLALLDAKKYVLTLSSFKLSFWMRFKLI